VQLQTLYSENDPRQNMLFIAMYRTLPKSFFNQGLLPPIFFGFFHQIEVFFI